MFTAAARRSFAHDDASVLSLHQLVQRGWTYEQIGAQVTARRWQRLGRAVLQHNATPTPRELRLAALIAAGPTAALTSFTALEEWGLHGWERDVIHLLVPRGARIARVPRLSMRVHYVKQWDPSTVNGARRLHRPAPAALLGAAGLDRPRSACGILAAAVQQRILTSSAILESLTAQTRIRHRAVLLAATHDIAQGAQALSEIDFARLCRRAGLPPPCRQAVRVERSGRRRYLDAEWVLPNGRRLVVEVDGALHLAARRWWDDQLRQNELVIAGDLVLRYPSVIVRCEPDLVIAQLRRAPL